MTKYSSLKINIAKKKLYYLSIRLFIRNYHLSFVEYNMLQSYMNKNILISFFIVTVLLFLLGLLSISKITELSELTEKLYKHPLATTAATKNIKFHITSMHRYMKDVVLSKNINELNTAVAQVNKSEKIVYEQYAIIFERYLGDKKEITSSYNAFVSWKKIRNEIIDVTNSGERQKAADITKAKGARHVQKLYEEVDVLISSAKNKAIYFLKNASEAKDTAIFRIITVLLIIFSIIIFLAILLAKNLNSIESHRVKQENLLVEQGRLAQMGEMISMIAHQWRQPLTSITVIATNIKLKYELDFFNFDTKQGQEDNKEFIALELGKVEENIQNLSNTINDFRNFYTPNKELEHIDIDTLIQKSLDIIRPTLVVQNIEILEEYNSNQEIDVYGNELMQVILNILQNAQDNFKENEIKEAKITITTKMNNITISDNGGGINQDIIDKIFDPYFSTKSRKNGTGLGLYMSKTIIEEHHKGRISATNVGDGVCFEIDLPESLQ